MINGNGMDSLNPEQIILQTADFVRSSLQGAESGHDWWHVYRVWRTARHICETEKVDRLVVELGALLHDIADAKFHSGDESVGPAKAKAWLESIGVSATLVDHVVQIVQNVSFKNSFLPARFTSPELAVVQDADRLDALGAIGIARTFQYGGFKNREIYNPEIPPNPDQTKEAYKNSTAPTLNHFYEKLLLLKNRMNTATGRQMAVARHEFMEKYLEQFYQEWEGHF